MTQINKHHAATPRPVYDARRARETEANLITEAFAVAAETGLSPRQLANANAALRAAHNIAAKAWKIERAALLTEMMQARHYVNTIAKLTCERRIHDDLARIDAAIARAAEGGAA